MIKFSFDVSVVVESELSLDELRRFRDRCHDVVSALACYLKHARLPKDAERISTNVDSHNFKESV